MSEFDQRERLGRVEGERYGLEEMLKGPTAGQVDADAAGRLANASAEFEQLGAQSFDLCRAQRRGQVQAKEY